MGPQWAETRHFTVAFPNSTNPVTQLYVTTPLNVVLVGVPEDPLSMEGGRPQETAGENIEVLKLIGITFINRSLGMNFFQKFQFSVLI